jgi:hypothetical protein
MQKAERELMSTKFCAVHTGPFGLGGATLSTINVSVAGEGVWLLDRTLGQFLRHLLHGNSLAFDDEDWPATHPVRDW